MSIMPNGLTFCLDYLGAYHALILGMHYCDDYLK